MVSRFALIWACRSLNAAAFWLRSPSSLPWRPWKYSSFSLASCVAPASRFCAVASFTARSWDSFRIVSASARLSRSHRCSVPTMSLRSTMDCVTPGQLEAVPSSTCSASSCSCSPANASEVASCSCSTGG